MKIPEHFSDELSFEEQLLYVLSVLKKGSANEIAIELMELKGVSSEEEVADLTVHTERELEKLQAERRVKALKEGHEKKRYVIAESDEN
jgi:hypothetical protein